VAKKKAEPKGGAVAWLRKSGRRPIGLALPEDEYDLVSRASALSPRESMAELCRRGAVEEARKKILAAKQKSA
jgi:hypothetical protein